jgi:HPt (histidine-containing phosphotransfer) domain-containing protein
MKPLALQKQLLIEESEMNRILLVQDWRTMKDEVHSLAHRVGTISSVVSLTAALVAGLAFFRRQKSAPTAEKPSWLQTLLKGAGLFSTLWQSFRPQNCSQKDK